MSLLATPLLISNLGCEMLYILEQRLKAQNIPPDKSHKVLHDVVKTMFDKSFVSEKLFVPQEMYSLQSTRKIFDRLAHSSIMRLSESSMDKLYDLMMMGFKYQLLCGTSLSDVIQATLTHLETVRALMRALGESAPVEALLNHTVASVDKIYSPLTMGQLHLLRQTLARFFQDRRIKVSLFLQEGVQTSAGRMILPSPVAKGVGTVTYFKPDGSVASESKLVLASQKVNPDEFFCHPVPLGSNLYNKERPKVTPPTRKQGQGLVVAPKADAPESAASMPGGTASRKQLYAEDVLEKGSGDGKKELDLLASLMKVQGQTGKADNFKLNLFEKEDEAIVTSYEFDAPRVTALKFTGNVNEYRAKNMSKVMEQMSVADGKGASSSGDLLDLMDSVS